MKFCVYFYYDKNDNLLYIGKSKRVYNRWLEHQESWKKDVVKIGVREYPDEAAMDIYERYYITRLDACYNTALLWHGKTSVCLNDSSDFKIYTVDEFKKKYCQSVSHNTIAERMRGGGEDSFEKMLISEGFELIELSSSKLDVFNENILQYDLDKVCFKYNGIYFYSKYLQKNRKEKNKYSYETNNILLSLKTLTQNIRNLKKISVNAWTFTVDVDNNISEQDTIRPVLNSTGIFEIIKLKQLNGGVRLSRRGKNSRFLDAISCSNDVQNKCIYEMECCCDLFDRSSNIFLSSERLVYDLAKLA